MYIRFILLGVAGVFRGSQRSVLRELSSDFGLVASHTSCMGRPMRNASLTGMTSQYASQSFRPHPPSAGVVMIPPGGDLSTGKAVCQLISQPYNGT